MTKNILRYYVYGCLFLLPLMTVPTFVDGLGTGKNWFLEVSALIGLILVAVDLIVAKREAVKYNKVLLVGVALAVWSLVSWWGLPQGVRMRSFTNPLGLGTLTALVTWMFVWLQVASEEESKRQLLPLTAAGIVMAVSSLIVFLFPASKLPIYIPGKDNPMLSIGSAFSFGGSILAEATMLLLLAIEWVRRLLGKLKSNENKSYYLEAGMTALFVLILMLDVFKIVKSGWVVLDGVSAWVIATEVFKRSPLLGVGPGNFVQAFNVLRPASYNLTSYWSNGFNGSSMGILHIWTELGVVSLVLIGIFLAGLLRRIKGGIDFGVVLLYVVLVAVLPLQLLTVILLTWLLASRLYEKQKVGLVLKMGDKGINAAPYMVAAVMVAGGVSGLFQLGKVALAETYYRNSLVAASKNNGGDTYNWQIKAISMNPYLADYRRTYSQTNLALAQTLLSNEKPSDDDKQKASVLIQQAVREGKAAVALDGLNSVYWSNLATIYKSLIGLVDGSADWSYQAYQQAVALDPVNPLLKMDLGGLLFAAGQYDSAERVFEEAVTNKQDYANAWYNWAYTAKQMNKIDVAVSRLKQAVSLVPKESGDYDKANEELNTWQKELDEAIKKYQAQQAAAQQQQQQQQQKQPETLRTPSPLPTVGAEEKVNVPAQDLQPPKPEVTITPSPTKAAVTPTPSKAAVTPTKTAASPTQSP